MIKKIEIKNIASYSPEGEEIPDLKKVNFFFGNNGSGKSTITKFLYNLNLQKDLSATRYKNCTTEGFNDQTHQILVFDDQFVKRNFINKNFQPGIFSLNEKNDEIDELINAEKEKLKIDENHFNGVLPSREKKLKELLHKSTEELKKTCFKERKAFDTFYQHDIKYKGSSSRHLEKIEDVLKNQPIPSISIKNLSERYDKIYKNEIQKIETKIPTLAYRLIRKKEEEIQLLMQEVIVGNSDVDIAKMIEKFNSKSWVEDGIKFLDNDLKKQKCPFCQEETISQELIKKFSQYFDKEYKEKIEALNNLKENYIKLYTRYLELFNELKTEFNEDNIVSESIIELKAYFEENTRKIEEKIKDSSGKIKLNSLYDFKERVVEINRRIFENNEAFRNIGKIKEKLTQDIWYYLTLKSAKKIECYRDFEFRINANLSLIDELKESVFSRIEESKKLIEELRNSTVSTSDAVDNINNILRNCGFTGFKIESKEVENGITKYYLKRNSNKETEVFKTLSEGEKNFISFLYFYQLCLGTEKIQDSEKLKIIVIDDPVSSLDSQVLFIVNSLIHQLIARKSSASKPDKQNYLNPNIDQVFILTHNIFFFKEITLDNGRGCTLRQFYHITKINNVSYVTTKGEKEIGTSDYNLMWSSLKSIKDSNTATNVQNILIGNLMRRIIESYVNFLGIGKSVWAALNGVDPEDTRNFIFSGLISEVSDTSHKVSPLDDIYFTRIMNENPDSLFDAFKDIFKEIGKEHYELMMNESIEEEISN